MGKESHTLYADRPKNKANETAKDISSTDTTRMMTVPQVMLGRAKGW